MLSIAFLILISCVTAFSISNAQSNFLINPGFENGFRTYNNIGVLYVGNGWTPWYQENVRSPGGVTYFRPEYKEETIGVGSGRVLEGNSSQKMFTTYAPHNGGAYQRVSTVPGRCYEFGGSVYIWSSSENDPNISVKPGRYRALVGANPWGSADIMSDTTLWGKEVVDVYDRWVDLDVQFEAWSTSAIVVFRGNPWYGVHHNDSYWDKMYVMEISCPGVSGPTPTPYPTYTPYPTPVPCGTPVPGNCPTKEEIASEVWLTGIPLLRELLASIRIYFP